VIVERDGVALNVLAEGSGEPVVLLHGHTLDLRTWDEVAPALLAAGLRVVRYDQRGHGRSSSPAAGYRWGDHAADLAEVIAELAGRPAHIVGLSAGGGIALEIALRRPELVRSLALIGPRVPDARLSDASVASFRDLALKIRSLGVQEAVRQAWLPHPLIAPAAARRGVRERLEAMVLTFPGGEYLAAARDIADREWKVPDRLGEIAVPTLVVRGDGEIPDFVAMADLVVARVPGARLLVISGSGHLVPLEQPGALAEALTAFLPQRR
jgi:3-oxoadipate enol-lactonase